MAARVCFWRLAIRLVAFLLLAPLPPIMYLSHFGFPDWTKHRIVAAADAKGYCLEMQGIYLNIFEGIVFDSPRLFEKGVFGPPLFEASEITIGLRYFGAEGLRRISHIAIRNGTLRSFATQEVTTASTNAFPADFPGLDLQVTLDSCVVQHIPISHLTCDVLTYGPRLRLDHILAKVGREDQSGPLSGGLLYNHANGRFAGRTVSDLDPNALLSFLESKGMHGLVSLTKSFAFPDRPPIAETRFTGCAGTNFTLALDGSVKARTFRRYGLEVRQAETQLAVQLGPGKGFVALCPLVAIRDEGRAEVDLTIDLENHTVSFIGTGTADPRAVMKAIDPSTADLLNDLHIAGPARYSARGFVNITNLDVCNIELVADAKSFGLKQFVADECSFSFRRTGHAMVVSNLQASIFGGKMTGSVSFEPEAGSTNTRFRAKGNIDKVAFRKLVEAIAGPLATKDDLTGELSGSIAADGLLGKGMGHTIDGRGELRIRDGNVFQLPLFGKLSEMLARKVPGLGYVLRQDSADAVFSIERGKLKTDALRIEGDILSLKSNGSYDIKADQLDFDVELRFLRNKTWVGDILQTILLPVTKLFRVRLQGRLDDPTWDSVNF